MTDSGFEARPLAVDSRPRNSDPRPRRIVRQFCGLGPYAKFDGTMPLCTTGRWPGPERGTRASSGWHNPRVARRAPGGVVVVLVIVVAGLGFIVGGVFEFVVRETGTPARATILSCRTVG